jgi:chemotaxis protein MotA
MALVGILVVFGCVCGGFAMAGGHFGILIQPSEFVVIIGAAVGALIAAAPGKMRSRVGHVLKTALKDAIPKKSDYLSLLKVQFEIYMLVRRNGILALEPHLNDPTKSDIFRKYPTVLANHHGLVFFTEALQQMVNAVSAEDLDLMLDSEIDTFKAEGHLPVGLLRSVGDSLPGIGIVAAVLGIIITMGHMDGPPAEIGLHVAAALVGTFLGILLCYGVVGPLVANAETQEQHQLRYLECIRAGILASLRGAAPAIAIEFARKVIFSDERPSFAETEKACQSLRGG